MLQSSTISPGEFMMPSHFSRNQSPLNFSAVMIRQLVPVKKKNKTKKKTKLIIYLFKKKKKK
jgi:hypothetical protein